MRHATQPAENEWQLQEAKARLSEVFTLARSRGPQRITRHGKEAVVMLPAEEFERLTDRSRQPRSLVEFFSASPLSRSGIRLDRKPDYGRKVSF
jgi:prevent-host-death family protein